MVGTVTSLTRSGARDWFIQRITAVILGLYFIFLLVYLLCSSPLTFESWQQLFASPYMRIFSFLALASLIFHAWVGIWTVLTDYVHPITLRYIIQVIIILALVAYLAWGIEIIWGLR